MSVSPPPLPEHGRERRKRSTRRALRAATLDLGLERSLTEVSVEEIAERAGVSTRTFFNYFDTKEDAALLELLAVPDQVLEEFASSPPAGAWADLTDLFSVDVERATDGGLDVERYLALQQRNPAVGNRQLAVFARFEGRLTDAVHARLGGAPETLLPATMMAGGCITAVRVGLAAWTADGRLRPVREHVEAAFGVLDPAFAAAPAAAVT